MKNRKKQVSIISRESNDKPLDISMLEEELLGRGIEVRTLCRLLTKEKSLKALGYLGHVLKQEAAILASDAVILDTYCIPASMLPHRRGTKIIQMWHALGAIKKFGWQTVGMEGGSSERTARLMKMHRGYDYVISPSDITAAYFSEAFDTPPDRIAKYGLPRIDYIKSVSGGDRCEDMRRKIFARYPALNDGSEKMTVLYAPTFRMGRSVDAESLAGVLDKDKFDLVVKLHSLYRSDAPRMSDASVIYDDEFPSFDWLSVADVIISDYSSFVIEASLADKPLCIYAYDLDEYEKSTGLNMDFSSEPIAPYVFRDAESLAALLNSLAAERLSGSEKEYKAYDMEALRAFRDRYIDIDTKHCTSDLADFIQSLIR